MEQRMQKLNADQRLAVWIQRIADCRSSGKSVKHWCQENDISEKTYYYWQKRIFKMAQEQQTPEFAGVHHCCPVSSVISYYVLMKSENNDVMKTAKNILARR